MWSMLQGVKMVIAYGQILHSMLKKLAMIRSIQTVLNITLKNETMEEI